VFNIDLGPAENTSCHWPARNSLVRFKNGFSCHTNAAGVPDLPPDNARNKKLLFNVSSFLILLYRSLCAAHNISPFLVILLIAASCPPADMPQMILFCIAYPF
jgi:hypothetical protein